MGEWPCLNWMQTASMVTMICLATGGAWAVIQIYSEPWIRILAVGGACFIIYICLRWVSKWNTGKLPLYRPFHHKITSLFRLLICLPLQISGSEHLNCVSESQGVSPQNRQLENGWGEPEWRQQPTYSHSSLVKQQRNPNSPCEDQYDPGMTYNSFLLLFGEICWLVEWINGLW